MEFQFSEDIFGENDFVDVQDYVPDALTDFGDEGIRIDCDTPNFQLENLKFNKDVRINIKESSKIKIKRCLFGGYLSFYIDSPNELDGIEIILYKNQINDIFSIGSIAIYDYISIDSCVINKVSLRGNIFKKIFIYHSEIFDLYFEGCKVDDFSLMRNFITTLSHYHADFIAVDIDVESFLGPHKSIKKIKPKNFSTDRILEIKNEIARLKKEKKNGDPFNNKTKNEWNKIIRHNIKVCKGSLKRTKKDSKEYFFSFAALLKKSKNESVDSKVIADLNYNIYRYKKYNLFVFVAMWLLGFFYKPSRVIFSSIAIVFLFGIAYYIISHSDCRLLTLNELSEYSNLKNVIIGFVRSIYFSGITFFTIGYSDLINDLPGLYSQMIKSLLVLLEGAFGIIFMSSLVISMANRYRIR